MSTQAMRALARLCRDEGYTPEIQAMGATAMQEVQAIEGAARIIDENVKIPAIPAEMEPALRLMGQIAKEAP
jgi:hypothetical protein